LKKFNIPLLVPEMPRTEELIPWLKQIDVNKIYTNFGPLNTKLEQSLRNSFINQANLQITTVSNCTVGIELALNCLNLKRGSSILVPSLTFAASATSIENCGFLPVFSDIDADTWILTPEIALAQLNSRNFDAVLPVSTFGAQQDVAGWDAFTKATGIPVVIDAASAFGNQEIGDITSAVFSLHATKSLGCGEGGFIASRNSDFIAQIKTMSNFGIVGQNYKGYIDRAGTNAKLSEYHAAVGLASLDRWDGVRRKNISNYQNYLQMLDEAKVSYVAQAHGKERNHTLLPIRLSTYDDEKIDALMGKLLEVGVQTRRWYYPLLNEYACFKEIAKNQNFPEAEIISRELIGLPFYPSISSNEIEYVITNLKRFI
jgi:dTDP-4-amino-4,6-dideoxygalactose transaminase